MADRPDVMLFDDGADLGPLTDLRAPFEIRTGALTLAERISHVWPEAALAGVRVRPELAPVVAERMGVPVIGPLAGSSGPPPLLVNGRVVVPDEAWAELGAGEAVVSGDGAVLAARLEAAAAERFLESGELGDGVTTREASSALVAQPWDVIRHRDAALAYDLGRLVAEWDTLPEADWSVIGDHPIRCSASARVLPGVVLDASAGPIVIEDEAVIRPNASLTGPVYVGAGSTVLDGAVVRAGTCIGPVCKVNGEVSGVIFQGHANKGHDGFLGDAHVGEWVNLGAGTTSSNLLNTYGEITAQRSPGARRERTGLTFFGAIIGDHTKTAIGTRLMTGSIIGTGAMIALSEQAPTAIGRFAWLTDDRRQVFRLAKFLDVAGAAMARRQRSVSPAERDRLTALHGASGEPS